MKPAAFELLERVTQAMLAVLYREQVNPPQKQITFSLDVEIADIKRLLDYARHEQKGGA